MTNIEIFEIIKNNVKEYYCDHGASPEEIFSLMEDDGSFRDLDYVKQNWTCWGPHRHIYRIKTLSSIYAASQNVFYRDEKIAEAIHRGLAYFLKGNFRSDNWWMNDVGVPTECGLIRLMFKDNLTEEENSALIVYAAGNPDLPRVFSYCSNPDAEALRPYASEGMHMLSQLVDTHFQLVAEDADPDYAMKKINECIDAINYEFRVITYPAGRSFSHLYSDEHCIKTDYSYHEHENAFVHNTYGYGVIEALAPLSIFWKGTSLKPDDTAIREFTNLLLDGFGLTKYRRVPSMMTVGRDIANADRKDYSRQNGGLMDFTKIVIQVCDALLDWNTGYRIDEISRWREMNLYPEKTDHFTRTKYFWHSDFFSHNRKNYHFSVHAVSNRIKRPESILKKNVLGMFLGDGCYNIMQTGKEYNGMAPFADWCKMPGTTVTCAEVCLNPECEIQIKDDKRILGGAKGKTSFVGGVSDELYGMFAYDYSHLNVYAKKAWFAFDEGIVCLGAGIRAHNNEEVFTTLNQCIRNGNVIVDGCELNEGEHNLSNVKYILSDSIGYMFINKEKNIYLANEKRVGSWDRVDLDSGTSDPVDGDIFLLGINHGKCDEKQNYAYFIMPGADEESLERMSDEPVFEVVSNTEKCQAVRHLNTQQMQVVFYEKGSLSIEGFNIDVSKPCVLLLTFNEDDYKLWLSNPEHQEAIIKVKLSGKINNEIVFNLEEGFRKNNLGRPQCYDSNVGIMPYVGAQTENLEV